MSDEVLHIFRDTVSNGNDVQSVCYYGDEAKQKIEEYTNNECIVIGYEKTGQQASE